MSKLNKNGNCRGMSPNSRKNLALGWKGNNHALKDFSITRVAKEMLDEEADKRWIHPSDYGKTWRQCLAKSLLVGAYKREKTPLKELLDRLEGRPQESVEISTGKGKPLEVRYFEFPSISNDGN